MRIRLYLISAIVFISACTLYRSVGRKDFERKAPDNMVTREISVLSKTDQSYLAQAEGLSAIQCEPAMSTAPQDAIYVSKFGAYRLLSLSPELQAQAAIWRFNAGKLFLCWSEWQFWDENWVRAWLKSGDEK